MTAPITGWARPCACAERSSFHGVIEIVPRGSVITACRGRWSSDEDREYIDGRDREVDHNGRTFVKCLACLRVAREQRTREGLAELASAPVERRSRPGTNIGGVDDFDCGGES